MWHRDKFTFHIPENFNLHILGVNIKQGSSALGFVFSAWSLNVFLLQINCVFS